MTFKDLSIAEPILRAVDEKGYTQPTPIQQKGIPVALSGRDMLGIAQTGTGKTAAFAIPIIQKIWGEGRTDTVSATPTTDAPLAEPTTEATTEGKPARRDRRGRNHGKQGASARPVRALVLTPTRELALQISECFADYGKYTGVKHAVIFGGVKQGPQTEQLKRGVDILVATPGRLHDLINQGFINLDSIEYFVLDEADRMLDMGFIGDIRRLLPMLPEQRQTLFFSATMPDSIVSLSRSMLSNPQRVEVTPAASTVDTVEQRIYFVEKPDKKKLLVDVLREEADNTVLVFSRTKHGADNISRLLRKAGIRSEAIHGDKTQSQRQRALSDFKAGKVHVMVATDIAARGIDIDQLGMVINYDLPDVPETYVHRIGRTGRAGHTGRALTFCSQDEHMMVHDIQKLTGKKLDMVLVS
ncbi:MAG: DEAD/DEAH box helicase [Rikenellaceae bacterium]|jgi:ATP-dependent RNA helicase RhlE|nr:DEAD/DEAH box helicase [Rikenellaceae bacterium]